MQTASLTAEADHLTSPSSARFKGGSLFTGLNNLNVVSILEENYGEYFGFEQEEVDAMLDHYGVTKRREELRLWSDGFYFGTVSVYNPWSVLNSLKSLKKNSNAFLKPQWANTSSNEIVKTLVEGADREARADIEKLIAGGTVEKPIHEEVTYGEMTKNGDNLWNFLFFTGYLTLKGLRQQGVHLLAELCIPNLEVFYIYETIINDWFEDGMRTRDLSPFQQAVVGEEIAQMTEILQGALLDTISFYDYKESYYHAFLAGLLNGTAKYSLRSNRESGYGRPDIALIPDSKSRTVIIVEVKVCAEVDDLESKAAEALAQIKERNYQAEWRLYSRFLLYGIAFYKKDVYIIAENKDSFEAQIAKPTARKAKGGLYGGVKCTATEIAVINFLKENPSATNPEIAGAIGKSVRTVQTALRSLKGKGLAGIV
jgi:hypothetical protein